MTDEYKKRRQKPEEGVREALPQEIKWAAPVTRGEFREAIAELRSEQQQGFDRLEKIIIGQRGEFKEDIANLRGEFKEDNANLRGEVKEDIANLRSELKEDNANLRSELKEDIANLRSELKEDIANLRAETKKDIANLRDELKDYIAKSQIRMLLAITAIFAGIAGSMLAGVFALVR